MNTWAIIYGIAAAIMLAYMLFRLIRYLVQYHSIIKEKISHPSEWAKSVKYSVGYVALCTPLMLPALIAFFTKKPAKAEMISAAIINLIFGVIAISELYASCEREAHNKREELRKKESELEIATRDLEHLRNAYHKLKEEMKRDAELR